MEPKTPSIEYTAGEIKTWLEEYHSTGYSVKEYCFANRGIDEATLEGWLLQYPLDKVQNDDDDDAFIIVNPIPERKRRGPKKRLEQPETMPVPFATIGDIVLYQMVPAPYLKSLKS